MTSAGAGGQRAAQEAWKIMADLVLDNQRRREVSQVTGLSFGRMRALRRIAAGPKPMRELAGLLGVDPPNLTAVVDDLEQAGLVARRPHPTDRRIRLVAATDAGADLARRADEVLGRPPQGLSDLAPDELAALVSTLSRVRAAGGATHEEAPASR